MFKLLLTLIIFASPIALTAQIRNDTDRRMNRQVEPFRIIGNIYYVGASDVASYLITSDKGHILIDGGFDETVPMIEKNIVKLGFQMADIKILLNNHAHYDHAGGLAALKKKTGAKLYALQEQAVHLERGGKNDFRFADQISFKPVKVDRVLSFGELVRLGTTKLKPYFTPGHTKGCTTWKTTAKENGGYFKVVFQCSLSTLDYKLVNNPRYPKISRDFKRTFSKLKKMNVDVFLGSHAQFFKMEEKLKRWAKDKSKNPFIDRRSHSKFVKRMEKAFLEKLEKQTAKIR